MSANPSGKQVAVIVGATSKWQSDGRNTQLAHGQDIDDSDIPVGIRWGIGGAIAQKFAGEDFFTVLTTRTAANAAPLADAIRAQGGECMIVELDLVSEASVATAFKAIRREAGDPGVLIYNGLNFLQVLEGTRLNVEEVFNRIVQDPRHISVTTVLAESAELRMFAGWSMAGRKTSALAGRHEYEKIGETQDVLARQMPARVRQILENFCSLKGI